MAFAPSGNKIKPSPILLKTTTCLAATNNDMPTPLATDGDWSAYLDEETTGYGVYFVIIERMVYCVFIDVHAAILCFIDS